MSTEDDGSRIEVQTDGPYMVSGVRVRRKRQIASEHGEPLTWQTDDVLEEAGSVALCRCGGTSNPPFCDNTHAEGFDGTETAPTEPYDERAKTYDGTNITMRDDRGICEHAGFCGNRVTNVWKMMRKTDDTQVRAQAIGMIERCPSGALTYEIDGDRIEPDLPAEVGVVDDGPLWVTGGVEVQRSDGEPLPTRNRMTLCRCGASSMKPLCDGSHAEIGWSESG